MRLLARLLLLCLGSLAILIAQAQSWRGGWTATNGSSTFGGAWTATLADDPSVAFGSWTLLDRAGKQLASGTWSMRKAEKRWEGSWQARGANGQTYSGTWTARSPIVSPSQLSDLFDFALSNITSGTWQAGRRNGPWSIRAYPKE